MPIKKKKKKKKKKYIHFTFTLRNILTHFSSFLLRDKLYEKAHLM
jgi:hypothetical protein